MSDYGIKVSRFTKDADSSDIKDYVFDSNANIIKTIKSGVKNLSISGGSGTVEIYHGLGYVPTFTAYYADGSNFLIETANAFSVNYGRESSSVVIGVSANSSKLKIQGRGSDGTYPVYYEIFEQGGYR